jgi:nucleoid-associated protein YgaU
MWRSRLWLNVVLVSIVVLLVAIPGTALAAPGFPAPFAQAANGSHWWSVSAPWSRWGFSSYQVNWGDTLSSIAERYHTSVRYLQLINGIFDPNRIYAGQWLRVPRA